MKNLIEFFLKKSLVVNLITILIFAIGITSAFTLQKESFPNIDFDVIVVSTGYPGTTTEDIEKLVTMGMEREIKAVSGIDEMNAVSTEGRSVVNLKVDPDADIDEVLEDVKTAVDTVDDLPEDATTPWVKSINNKLKSVIKIPISGPSYDVIRKEAKRLRDRLETLKPVSIVNMDGYTPDQIEIRIDPKKLNDYQITVSEVSQAISSRNLNLSAGKFETKRGDISLRTVSEFENTKDIEDVVIRSNDSGLGVRVKDVATVYRGPDESRALERSNGRPSIVLEVKIKEHADILKSVTLIKKTTENYFNGNTLHKDSAFVYVDDMSYYVKRRLSILKNNGLVGIILVFLCLMLFLDWRTSLVTSLGAPLAFMISFGVMQVMGVSINLISMFAMILVLGMLVDDSIIVAEHFYQKIEQGIPRYRAAREAAIETIKPVSATIITTLFAFGALFFMGGIMGKFLWSVPMVVIICLAASWLECFFILPSHLNDFCKDKESGATTERRWYLPIVNYYKKFLNRTLDKNWMIVVTFFVILVGAVLLGKTMRFELFPGDDVRIVFLQLKGSVGTPQSETDQALMKLENLALQLPKTEVEQVRAQVGVLWSRQSRKTGSHYGTMILYLTPPGDRDRSTDEILNDMVERSKTLVPGFNVVFEKMQGGPPKGKAVEVELTGDSLEELKRASKIVKAKLDGVKGVTSTEIDFEEGKKQIVATVDQQEASRLGVSTQALALELRRAFAKDSVTEIKESDEDIEIIPIIASEYREDPKTLDQLFILNNRGQRIKISRFVKFEENPGAFTIRRKDRKRIFSVTGSINKEDTTPLKVVEDMKPIMANVIKEFPNLSYEFAGENKDTKESMVNLTRSFVIALLMIFFTLVVMFNSFSQPMVIMSAIPLGLIGVVTSFKIFGLSLGFMAMMGVVGLVGVVVNDSIVLVNFINVKREEIPDMLEAVIEACISRLRPVLLTTFTTVAGLLPVAHDPSGDPFLKPMALSFAYGLLFATFVTLIFVPSAYLTNERILSWFRKKFKKSSQADEAIA